MSIGHGRQRLAEQGSRTVEIAPGVLRRLPFCSSMYFVLLPVSLSHRLAPSLRERSRPVRACCLSSKRPSVNIAGAFRLKKFAPLNLQRREASSVARGRVCTADVRMHCIWGPCGVLGR